MGINKIIREPWTTTFDKELRTKVNITAAELGTTANVVLEVAFIYLKTNYNVEEARRILEGRKRGVKHE